MTTGGGDAALNVLIRAKDEASGTIDKVGGRLSKLQGPAKIAKLAMVGIGGAFGALALSGARMANELDQAMSEFRASTGVSGEAAKEFEEVIKDLHKVNTDSFEELAGAAAELQNVFGLAASDVANSMQVFLDYAKVTGQDDVAATKAVSSALKAFGKDAGDAKWLLDTLLTSQQKFGTTTGTVTNILAQNAGTFQALGLDMNQSIGLLSALEANGVNVSRAMMGLRSSVSKFESPEEFQQALTDLSNIDNATERAKVAMDIFGSFAGPGLAKLMGEGSDAISKYTLGVGEAQDAVADASKEFDSSLNVKLELMKRRVMDTTMGFVKFAPGLTAVAAIAGPMAPMLGAVAGAAGGLAITMVRRLIPAMAGMVLAMGPIGLVLAAITVAVGLFALAWSTNLFGIRDKIKWLGLQIKSIFGSIKSTILGLWDGVAGAFKLPINTIIRIINGFLGTYGAIISTIKKGLDAIPGPNPAGNALQFAADALKRGIPLLAQGGVVTEPTLLTSLRTGRATGIMAEAGPEVIAPLGRGGTQHIHIHLDGREIADYVIGVTGDAARLQFGTP